MSNVSVRRRRKARRRQKAQKEAESVLEALGAPPQHLNRYQPPLSVSLWQLQLITREMIKSALEAQRNG